MATPRHLPSAIIESMLVVSWKVVKTNTTDKVIATNITGVLEGTEIRLYLAKSQLVNRMVMFIGVRDQSIVL